MELCRRQEFSYLASNQRAMQRYHILSGKGWILSKWICLIILPPLFLSSCNFVDPPEPYGALPSERQLEWHKMKFYAFIHFSPNTFTDKEWGYGEESPSIFNPTELDCMQWARVASEAGRRRHGTVVARDGLELEF